MNLDQITTKCWILALFERDDGERLLLGDGWFDFKDSLQHFQPNTFANDVIELQGSDGQMLAGQVRRGAPQSFDGYIGDPITNRQTIEQHRREFLMFFRKRHHYKVVYIFPDGTAIQRKQGYITDAPSVPEIRQRFPEYHVALNFEDVNYYEYAENAQGEEIFSNIRNINISTAATGGLVWDNLGAVSDQMGWKDIATATGQMLAMTNPESIKAPIASFEMTGSIEQATYTGKNLFNATGGTTTVNGVTFTKNADGTYKANGTSTGFIAYTIGKVTFTSATTVTYSGCPVGGSMSTYSLNLQKDDGAVWLIDETGSGKTATLEANKAYSVRLVIRTGVTVSNIIYEPMVRLSSISDSSYEPYVGGTPAPNPQFPQPISTVTGRQTITVTGKNLIYIDPNFSYGITTTYNSATGEINISGTSTNSTTGSNGWANISKRTPISLPAGTYTLTRSVSRTYRTAVRLYHADGTYTQIICRPDITTRAETIAQDVVEYYVFCDSLPDTPINDTFTLQLEHGSSASSFEPYRAQNYEINLGKNLIEPRMPTWTYHGVTCTNNGDGSFTLNGTATATATWRIEQSTGGGSDNLRSLNGTYTLSCKGIQAGVSLVITQLNVWQTIGRVQNNETPSTFTSNLNDTLVYIAVTNGTTVNNVTVYPQLEKGSIASSYSPYFTPIELCKMVGASTTWQDRIYKENGKWYIEKQTGKVVLTGGETIGKGGTTRNQYFYANVLSNYVKPSNNDQLVPHFSNRFVNRTPNQLSGGSVIGSAIRTDNAVGFAFGASSEIDTIDKCKTWLASNLPTVYYPLATPTTTEITDAALIAQLEALLNATLYAGQNNISVGSADLAGPLDITYALFDKTNRHKVYIWSGSDNTWQIIVP